LLQLAAGASAAPAAARLPIQYELTLTLAGRVSRWLIAVKGSTAWNVQGWGEPAKAGVL
jgi:hypothetical protein